MRHLADGRWEVLGEYPRRAGLTARAARTQAILTATKGRAQAGDRYAAVLLSEWRIAQVW